MHYVDVGEGDPILFLHGNPTSSYLWRNVIPHCQPHGRCIAPDLIGMGRSDKPDIAYRFEDHYRYLEGFIEALDLEDVTLVLHDWGSGLGFHYAHTHPDNVVGMAFMEAMVRPWTWGDMPREFRLLFRLFRTPVVGWVVISVANLFVKRMLPDTVVRELSAEERRRYAEPYPTISSRKPVRVWPREIPIDGKPARVHDTVAAYSEWLTRTDIPKLCFTVDPGAIIRADDVAFIEREFPETTTVDLGEGIHFVQEDHPHRIGEELASWYTQTVRSAGRSGARGEAAGADGGVEN